MAPLATEPHDRPKPVKRTRVLLNKQSKGGCFTCKARRVKCDESRPTCLRCHRSRKTCAGYASESSSTPDASSTYADSSSPVIPSTIKHAQTTLVGPYSTPPTNPGVSWSSRRYAGLACAVLGSLSHGLDSKAGTLLFSQVLPTLCSTSSAVHTAAAAFGSAYHAKLFKRNSVVSSGTWYGQALCLLQSAIGTTFHNRLPIILTSILLAATDAVQQRRRIARFHALGAFTVVYPVSTEWGLSRDCQDEAPAAAELQAFGADADDLSSWFDSLDNQVALSGWGSKPFLPPLKTSAHHFSYETVHDLETLQPTVLHNCLHFVAEASRSEWKYCTDFPAPTIINQGRQLAALRRWLVAFDDIFGRRRTRPIPTDLSNGPSRHLLVLKAQCLSFLIAISNFKTPSELTYDAFQDQFESLIECAEGALGLRLGAASTDPEINLPPFSVLPRIIQPLFMTARKCRDSRIRRRALWLLQYSGFEGIANGSLDANVAARIIEIEEQRPFDMYLADNQVLTADDIGDSKRVTRCWKIGASAGRSENLFKFSRRLVPDSPESGPRATLDHAECETWGEAIDIVTCKYSRKITKYLSGAERQEPWTDVPMW